MIGPPGADLVITAMEDTRAGYLPHFGLESETQNYGLLWAGPQAEVKERFPGCLTHT